MQQDQQLCYLSPNAARSQARAGQGPAGSSLPMGITIPRSPRAWSWNLALSPCWPWGSVPGMLLQLPSKPSSWKDSRHFLCSLQGGGSFLLPFSCCTTFLHLPSFNVLIKRLIKEVIHEKDGYLDKAQRLVAALSPQISILHATERQKRQIFVPLSFHHCSSKDQSLQKINLKENF